MTENGFYKTAALILLLTLFAVCILIRFAVNYFRRRAEERRHLQICLEKGRMGESITAEYILKLRGYKRLVTNLWIPKNDKGDTAELDMVLIHEKGIFVIENKNYTGWIYGCEEDGCWCQTTGGQHYHFYNPVRQNRSHIRCLKRFLNMDLIPFYSVVTFNSGAHLRIKGIRSKDIVVTGSAKVKRKLKRKIRWKRRVLSKREVEDIFQILKQQQAPSKKVVKRHVKELKKYR